MLTKPDCWAENSPSCYGAGDGSASITVTGGVTPYTYLWYPTPTVQTSTTATGLDVDDYNVEVTDANSCKLVISVSIASPTQIVDSVSTSPTT